MNEILKFITDAKVFYLATVEGDKPRVRPFGFAMEHEGKIYFCTSNEKNVCKQLVSNPYFEVCTMSDKGQWIRLQGKAVFDKSLKAKAKVFEVMPSLADVYKTPENPIFEVFYVEEAAATLYSFSDAPRVIKL
ncbi:pyridoxamine 5'-phosphate oxidase family protein [Clostridium estertheticum]|uniref:pyridoxamine 5'-phosphate oxidase family protein n=1 Tax=Clostridium estertheticum TaxID=238834 RepID=UPI001C0CC6BE|nr:pyridoxamine 5'-phosphate oxidase family protein [Clostridium estertheticum]MBU3177997.1 pyridoxamine 5'-phosphate oxidase family protein [Clostridium estertheticum]